MPLTFRKMIGFILLLATLGLISWQALFAI